MWCRWRRRPSGLPADEELATVTLERPPRRIEQPPPLGPSRSRSSTFAAARSSGKGPTRARRSICSQAAERSRRGGSTSGCRGPAAGGLLTLDEQRALLALSRSVRPPPRLARASGRGSLEHVIEVRWASGPADMRGAVLVREAVFCREQGVPKDEELDGLDDRALHLVALAPDGAVVGTPATPPRRRRREDRTGRGERRWRRRGIASRMLAMALAGARERGCRRARLASQLQATQLYEEAGFSVESEPFEEAGIPHVWMGRPVEARR